MLVGAGTVARLHAIHTAANANKAMMGRVKTAIPTDFPMLGAPWLVSGLASLFGRSRLANVMPPLANVLISNVPGSPVPLYLAGAKVISYYPVSIPAHSMALNVTVQSYDGRLDYGLIACRRAVPDINDLGDFLLAEHQTLLALAQEHAAMAAAAAVAADAAAQVTSAKTAAKPKAKARAKPKAPAKPNAVAKSSLKAPAKSALKLVSAKPAAAPRKRSVAKKPAAL